MKSKTRWKFELRVTDLQDCFVESKRSGHSHKAQDQKGGQTKDEHVAKVKHVGGSFIRLQCFEVRDGVKHDP